MKYDVKNIKLAEKGLKRIKWAAKEMPVLRFKKLSLGLVFISQQKQPILC